MNRIARACLRLSIPLILLPGVWSGGLPKQWATPVTIPAAHAQSQMDAAQLYEQANPAVVTILNGRGHGSGFVIDSQGLVITNAHVVADGPRVVTVRLHDGRQVPADVIGFAQDGVDLAALRIHGQSPLPSLALAPAGSLRVGQPIFVIGTPLNPQLHNTLLEGMISRVEGDSGMLQHDANTHPGTSGAPLLNARGQVIGVNFGGIQSAVKTAAGRPIGYTPSGLNFAVSLDRLQTFAQDLGNGQVSRVSTLPQTQSSEKMTKIALNGRPLQGSLVKGDHRMQAGQLADLFVFEGHKRQSLELTLTSSDFDPSLGLYRVVKKQDKQTLKLVARNDDRGPGDTSAYLQVTLPKDATYVLITANALPNEQGTYTLATRSD